MERKPVKFDPNKSYIWDSEDKFVVTGAEIDAWNKAIGAVSSSEEFQRFLVILNGARKMGNFIQEAVEKGLIKEFEPKNQENGSSEPTSNETPDGQGTSTS